MIATLGLIKSFVMANLVPVLITAGVAAAGIGACSLYRSGKKAGKMEGQIKGYIKQHEKVQQAREERKKEHEEYLEKKAKLPTSGDLPAEEKLKNAGRLLSE